MDNQNNQEIEQDDTSTSAQRDPQPDQDQDQAPGQVQNQVYSYTAPWTVYALGISSKPLASPRLGIGSFDESVNNEVQVVQLFKNEEEHFKVIASFSHKYSPTKLLWVPDLTGTAPELMATSGEHLKIWEFDEETQKVKLKCDLINASEFNAPLTSFDWNCKSLNYIGTASIDTTCTIWDIEKQAVFTQLIAHDKEVYDISFSCEEKIFASVGADGSCRQFDLRNLEHSTVLYETDNNPLLKLAWNKLDSNYLAVIEMDDKHVTLLDIRQPQLPLAKLRNHKDFVNAIAWAPHSATHICSVADDAQALIWDLTEIYAKSDINCNDCEKPQCIKANQQQDPLLEYKAEAEISNLAWSLVQNDLISICCGNNLSILNV